MHQSLCWCRTPLRHSVPHGTKRYGLLSHFTGEETETRGQHCQLTVVQPEADLRLGCEEVLSWKAHNLFGDFQKLT